MTRRRLATRLAAAALSLAPLPTDQIGVPGAPAGTEITPEGSLYTGAAEVDWRYGPDLRAWNVPRRTLAEGHLPILTSSATTGDIRYRLTAWAAEVGGAPVDIVRVEVRNPTSRPRTARWAASVRWTGGSLRADGLWRHRFLRPDPSESPGDHFQPGDPFAPTATYAWSGRHLVRDGTPLLLTPPGARRRVDTGTLEPTTEGASAEYAVRVPARGVRRLVFRLAVPGGAPLDERASAAALERDTLTRWRARLAPAMRVTLPDRQAQDTFDASLVWMLMAQARTSFGLAQTVNLMNYHAFWLRDTAAILGAYEVAGLGREADRITPYVAQFQQPNGLFMSRPEQWDGWGQALWIYAERARRGGDREFAARVLPSVRRAMEWLAMQRARDPLGLMPFSRTYDNELVSGHLVGDDFWAVMGAEGAADIARVAGDPSQARTWAAQAADLRETVRRAALRAASANGGALPPALDAQGGRNWGNWWLAWPSAVFAPRDPLVTATLRQARSTFREGMATYGDNIHGYLGFRIWETELLRGEQERVAAGLRAALAHSTATHGGCEYCGRVDTPPHRRASWDNLTPHGWWAAEYVTLLRNMLVRETPGGGVRLLSAVPQDWLRPGRRISVAGAPTLRGRVSFTVRMTRGGAVIAWMTRLAAGTRLTLTVPSGARDVRARGLGRGTIALPGASGRIAVRWRL